MTLPENAFNYKVQNDAMKKAIQASVNNIFPIVNKNKQLNISNIRVVDELNDNDFPLQREIKLNRKTWDMPIVADFTLVDTDTGRVLDRMESKKIGNLPKITNRYTTLIDGNEYQTANQFRRKSGIYSRLKKNGELEAEFNLSKGRNFKMMMDPETGVFYLIFANRKYRVWTLLNTLGVQDKDFLKVWDKDILERNKKGAYNTEESELKSIYNIVYNKQPKTLDEAQAGLIRYFTDGTEMSGDVNKLTLGEAFTKVNAESLLATSKKLLDINKGEEVPDERDSLVFKDFYTIDDLVNSYFEKSSKVLKSKLERNLGLRERIKEVVTPSTFSDPVKRFFTVGDLASTPPQTNPITILSETRKTTPMGTGGIESSHAVTVDMRNLHPSHLGFLDGTSTPESGKVGVTLGLASEIKKKGKNLYTPVRDLNNKLHWFSPLEMYENTVGFPDQFKLSPNQDKLVPINNTVKAMQKNKTVELPASEVKYYLRSPKTMFAIQTNLMPFLANTQGNRASTGARMMTQALPLLNPDAPLLETKRDKDSTYEQLAGHSLGPNSEVSGIVTKIDDNYIYVKDKNNTEHKHGMYKDFPLNQDGFVNSYPIVEVGQNVKEGDLLAGNNYTKGDKIALSKNLNVGFLSYKGLNFEDGVVLTEGAAKKLTHETIHKENVYFSPKLTVFNKEKFNAWYPDVLTQANYNKLNSNGIIGKGQRVINGDVIAAYLVEKEMNDLDNALKKLDKITFNKYEKKILTWDNDDPGVVIDVKQVGRNIDIYIKAEHPLKEGDKISSLWGNKGIVTKIIPDDEAPHRPNGEPIEVMMSAEGIPGRMNIGQVHGMAASKIADKTGKPFIINNFENPDGDATKTLIDKAKELGIEYDEVLTDGKNGKKLVKPVFVGKQPIIKLRHIIEKKQGSHSIGAYDVYEQPAGKGAQRVGSLDVYGYLAHGAKNNLEEFATIKGRKNEEYWRDLQFGLPPGKPARNFVWEKMMADLKGMGVNTEKNGSKIRIMPMTDKDIMAMSSGEIKDPGTLLIGKNLLAKKGGLFDKDITGGAKGTNWAHFNLATRLPNPMFEDAVIKLLGLTENSYADIIAGKQELNGEKGPQAIVKALGAIDVPNELKNKKEELKIAPPTNVNKLNTTVKYLSALSNLKMTPTEAYTLSKLPVTPPQFRPIYPLPSGDLMISDINKHYKDIGVVNNGLKANMKDNNLTKEKEIESQAVLYNTVKALQGIIDPMTYSKQKYKGFLKEFGKIKTGTVHGRAWSKSQDLSGRSTITIEPDLDIDEVGVPHDMAYNMWKPLIIKELKSYGLKASEAKKQYTDKTDLSKKALVQVASSRPVIINRAPSLHKHSIQAFNPVLVDGKSIKLNPLIFSGFNADLDGDTMSIMTPIGTQAIEEAKDIMPSKILFKHGDNALVPELSKDYIYGLYQASKLGSNTGKIYKTITDAKKDKLTMTDVFTLDGKKMTLGQYYINKPLPPDLKDYGREMSKKTTQSLLTTIGKNYPNYFSEVISTWKDIGFNYAHDYGHTISINDFNMDKAYRNELIKKELPKIKKLNGKDKIKAYNELTLKVQDAQNKLLQKSNNSLKDMINSGSFSKADSVRQILSMPGVLEDIKGNPIEVPVLKSWGEGIDTASYFNSLYAVRKGTVDRAVNTQETGALTKSLLNVSRRTAITMEDCNTSKHLMMDVNSKDVLDRFAALSVPGVVQRNQLIDTNILLKAKIKKITELPVRSPLTCEAVDGICQKCYGLMPNGKEPVIGANVGILDGQALTERSTQLTMQTFHCYHGGSLVQTENGELRLIKDLVAEDYKGKVLDRNGEYTQVLSTSKHEVTDEMRIIMTKNKRQIIAQGNHPIQVKTNDYKCYYCDSVQVLKYGKTRYQCLNCFTKFEADKLIHTTNYITKEIKDVNRWDEALVRSQFEVKFGTAKWDWSISPIDVANYISNKDEELGLKFDDDTKARLLKECGDHRAERHLPPKILLYDKNIVHDIIITIFNNLGKFYVNKQWNKMKRQIGNVYLFTRNYPLANQLSIILQKLGFNATLTTYSQKRYLNKYLVRIHNVKESFWRRLSNFQIRVDNPLKQFLDFPERTNYVSRIKHFYHNTAEDQFVYDLETQSETLSVNEIWSHNSGGSAVAGGGVLEGFPNIKRLLQVPDKLGNKATLATTNGIVNNMVKNSVGGYDFNIGDVKHVSLPGQIPLVKPGDVVEQGDQLSSGAIKPQELGTLKGHLNAQKYIVDEMNKVFNNKYNKKTFETIVRSVSDNAEITEAPDDTGFIRGDKTTISYVEDLNKQRKKEGLDLIGYKPYFKSIETLNVDNNDWLTKVTTNRIKSAIRTGAAKGQYTNLKGKDPLPAYIYGDDFSKNT
jgi:DNA-directed RNA polymerase beta subunit/DNA-directed RNA polymerase beta' subunit